MKNVNLIEMLHGCSKRNGMAVSASNPDGQPTVNRQSRLMSHQGYLKNLAMIFAVLVMSVANIGMAWGETYTWSFANGSGTIAKTTTNFTSTSGSKTLIYDGGDGCAFDGDSGNKYLKMGGKSSYSAETPSDRFFKFLAPSSSGTVSISYAGTVNKTEISAGSNGSLVWDVITPTANETSTSKIISGLTAGSTYVYISCPADKSYIKSITWTDAALPYERVYYSEMKTCVWGTALESGASFTDHNSAIGIYGKGGSGWNSYFSNYLNISSSGGYATVSFSPALSLVSNESDKGRIRIYYSTTQANKNLSLEMNGSSAGTYNALLQYRTYVAEYTIPDATTNVSSIKMSQSGSGGIVIFAIEVLTYSSSTWYLPGSWYKNFERANNVKFTGSPLTLTLHLDEHTSYDFKLVKNNGSETWYDNSGGKVITTMRDWSIAGTSGGNNSVLFTGPEGDYTFTLDPGNQTLDIDYPNIHPDDNYMYFENTNVWGTVGAYIYSNDSWKVTSWEGTPSLANSTVEICGHTYHYCVAPRYSDDKTFENVIFRNLANSGQSSPRSAKKEYHGGKWSDNNSATIHDFSLYTISFDKGTGTGGTMASIKNICEDADQVLTANAFEKTGYTFNCWHANVAVKVGGNTIAAGGDIAGGATLQEINNDITLTAQWTPKTINITLNKGEHGAADQSATVAYDATTLTSITHVTPNTGYTLTGYYDGETKVLNANGTFAGANVSGYITSSKWTKATDCTLTAKWECVSLTVNLGGDAATPAGGSPIGTEYTLTCSASTGVIASYQWKQNTTASTTGAVNAEGTGATTASFRPVPAAAGTYYYYCVATDACGNSVNTSFSGAFQFNEPVDPCSEPAEVTNEIARFFVPCGTSTAAAWSTTADASTGYNSFTTSGFGGTGNNWYTNATSGLIYGKFQSSTYIIIKLKSGSFQAGDVVTAYFNLNSGTKTGLKLKDKDSGNSFEPTASASDVETSGTYTLKAADIENDGSIKFFRTSSSTYVNRIIVTRPPVSATITATKTSPDYVSPDPNNLVLSISTTGASSGWYYRVKNTGNDGYQTPDEVAYNTSTWTMTSGLSLGENNFVVELYNGSRVKQAESATITVTAETAYSITIAAGAGGSVSPSGEIKANESSNHIHPAITATPSSGYHFKNWTYSNSNATVADASSASTTVNDARGTCTITANFEADATLYTVTFNSNGGSSVDAIEQASVDASITMPAAPTKSGYTFQGWVIGGTTYAAGASYTPEANVTAYATWKADCAGGGGSGATLFSQNFNSATAVAYEDRAGSKLSITTSSGNNIVGNTAASQFTSITADKKGSTGIAINSASGGNSQSASGIFQAYYNNTSGYWSICKTSDFAATAPTAIKVGMKVWARVGSSSSAVMANFAVGDGFSDGLTNGSPGTSSVHSGFSITNESSMKFAAYNVYNTKIYNTALTQSSWMALTWVINNTGDDLEYDNPNSGKTTVNNDCYDLWLGTTLVAHNIAATTAAKDLQNLYIGSPSGKNHEIRLDDISVVDLSPAGSGCLYVTYNGNGAETGSISDATAYAAGDEVTVSSNTGASAFTKSGYHVGSWNTVANGSGTTYALGATFNISADVTLYAQWVADACSAPSAPTISGTSVRTVGQTITLNAACASGADASTTYTWFKGVDWATASAASPVQEALTAGEGGRIFNKASCVAGDAGTYWCEASNGDGCDAHNATGFAVTVNAAVATHIYYYKDADHYSDDTYSNPEGNTAASGDNKSLSSPWMICNGCMTGVDSVVAHGATYDGKGNYMNAYIKIPTGGTATTKNIKFALTEGYTGTLTIKIGGYKDNPTVTLQPLTAGVLGSAITPTSGTVGGVATTEDNFYPIVWPLSTAGGTYVLTVTTKTGYISQIDMTTSTSATFNVTYNGNDNTGGTVPTDATNYASGATVTAAANSGTLVKTNYTGAGWNTANNGTGTNYVPGSGTFKITANTTLYAHWTQLITLAPGTQGTGTNNAAVSWNGSVLRGFAAHTASGYALQGYYTEPSGGTKVLNADGSFAATNIDGFITDGKWSRTGAAATLYAQWSGSAIVTNTLGVGSSNKWSSAISTTAPLQITSLSALAAVGGLTIVDEKGTSASDRALTCKVEASGATTKTDGKYLQLSFSIAAGYKLRVTGLDVTVRSVGKAGKYHLELEGTTGSLIPDDEQVASGAVNTIFDDAYNVELTGDVTLKLWAYGKDGSNLMEYYRLGSPIAIYGAVEESCTPPTFSGLDYSATEYTQSPVASASAISVTGAENVESYQWKYNTVNDRTSGTNCGTDPSVTPSIESTGTLYYWCELTNGCTTVKTSTVAVTVRASASDPTVTWSNVKLGATDNVTPNYGGGNYTLRATVNETGWSGTLESSMVTAPAGITIHDVTTGTADDKKYIEFKFDVTTAFDREENETIGFHLSLSAISGTPNWNALTSDKQVAYEACDEGSGVGGMIYLPVKSTQTTAKSGMQYYWESTGSGRLASQYGGSAMGAANNPSGYKTADSTFYYYAASTGDKWMFQTYVGGVNKVRVVFRAGGALKSSNLTISKFCYDTEYFSSQGDRQVSIGEVSPSKASFASGEDGYMEFTVPEMAANSYVYFQTGSSNIKIYGIVLYSESSGSGGSVATNPVWSGGLENEGTVDKTQSDANFTYTISTTTNTLGAISYSSSNPSVAAVDPVTGEVTITATGASAQSATITATLARSGCYKGATRTYTINVAGYSCSEPSGSVELTSGSATKCASESVTLTMTGFTEGAAIQWYNGESIISNGDGYTITTTTTQSTLTTTAAGTYSAIATRSCAAKRTNSITIANMDMSEQKTVRKVSQWYVKNGRLTPDIALWQLGEGETFKSVAWSPANGTGLDFVTRNGIVYLEGKEPSTNTSADIPYTLTLTITDACGTDHVLSGQTIKLTHQKNTDKHVLAFVVTGKEKGGFTEGIPASQTNSVALYNEIAKNFDVLATNIYATDDEQKIKEYYSQFDIICITDYPNTKTKGSHSVSYSDAIGVMVDIRPVLTMEAWVSGLSNWNKKGISGDPKSPSTRQYTMLLQCKDHEIFAGTTLTEIGEGDDKMYRIHMVDETQHPYDTLDANYGSGTHESKKGYRYGSYPALQGFTFSQAMEDADLLPLGLIDDGAGKDLQVGLERQHEMSARMMVLGINSTAMERLTADGKRIVINALKYLMKKNAEEIADCSTSFVGGADGDETNWMNADNWTGNTVPDKTQKVRILAPCTVPAGEKAHVAGVLIAPNDGGAYNGGSTPTTGSLTIAAGGALVVDGKVESVTAPAYNRPRATAPADLTIQTSSTAQGALIFDNFEGETQATVEMYSKASGAPNDCKWQWIATPFSNVNKAVEFYYGAWMYEWDNATHGWTKILNDDPMEPFKGYSITQEAAGSYWMNGVLASTESREQTLRCDEISGKNNGINLIGNSWTAPIQIANFEAEDFTNAHATIFILNTGLDEHGTGTVGTNNSTAGQYIAIPVEASALMGSTLKVIPAMQAFQVKAHAGGGSLNMDYDRLVREGAVSQDQISEPMRAPDRQMRRAPRVNKAEVERMHITIRGSRFQDEVYIFAHPDFTEGFDNGWDGEKIRGASEAVQLFVRDATSRWAVAAVPTFVGTYLATYKGEDNEYTISFDYSGDETLYWYDTKTDIYTEINAENTYTYTTDVSTIQTRFLITNENPKLEVPTGIESEKATNTKAVKFIDEDKMYIMINGRVYSADGALVK